LVAKLLHIAIFSSKDVTLLEPNALLEDLSSTPDFSFASMPYLLVSVTVTMQMPFFHTGLFQVFSKII
jgi:hypothetical protein